MQYKGVTQRSLIEILKARSIKILLLTFAHYDTGKTYRLAVPLSRDKEVSLTLTTVLKR